MNGEDLKQARSKKNWTQETAATFLGVSQGYVSLLEGNHRAVSYKLAQKALRAFDVPPTSLPVRSAEMVAATGNVEDYAKSLGALGYPGFSYLRGRVDRNPAELLLGALSQSDLESRVAEGLPWVVFKYPDMNWDWLVKNAKLTDLQNRLGFVVTLARKVAEKTNAEAKVPVLAHYEALLERSRLAREDTFCHESLTETEKSWLREKRPTEAQHWNLLTDLAPEQLTYAT
jgi:transcriptional regulator with XRE-family HTH domain